jgi:hypothetical protein
LEAKSLPETTITMRFPNLLSLVLAARLSPANALPTSPDAVPCASVDNFTVDVRPLSYQIHFRRY